MKKAIGYIRISTKDQSVYSLPGQRSEIGNYCNKNDIQLLDVFEENGQSAKNFDRINWQQLEHYIKLNHKEIDYLIVYKYDRFSRNLTEALAMIDKLEKKYKIIILSILENIGVHPKSPMFFLFRTQLLLNANNELNYIKERTAFGMHQAPRPASSYMLHHLVTRTQRIAIRSLSSYQTRKGWISSGRLSRCIWLGYQWKIFAVN